jgi:hypothetical protein
VKEAELAEVFDYKKRMEKLYNLFDISLYKCALNSTVGCFYDWRRGVFSLGGSSSPGSDDGCSTVPSA